MTRDGSTKGTKARGQAGTKSAARTASSSGRKASSRGRKPAGFRVRQPLAAADGYGSPGDATDQRLIAEAIERQRVGQTPTGRQQAAIRRGERARDERMRAAHYAAIPQRVFLAKWGRQRKVVAEILEHHLGIPLRPEVSLDEFLPALARFFQTRRYTLAKHGGKDGEDGEPTVDEQRAELRLERERLELARIKGETIDRAEHAAALTALTQAFVGVLNRMPAGLASRLQRMGLPPAPGKREIEAYCDGQRVALIGEEKSKGRRSG